MIRRKPNIRDEHFEFNEEDEEFTCKTCGSTYSEIDAIGHLLEVHDYHHIDLLLDEVKED